MAKFDGATMRYNNSDDENREYDISAEILVSNGVVEAAQSINISINGIYLGNGIIQNLNSDTPESNFNICNMPVSEQKKAFNAMIDFVIGLITKRGNISDNNVN